MNNKPDSKTVGTLFMSCAKVLPLVLLLAACQVKPASDSGAPNSSEPTASVRPATSAPVDHARFLTGGSGPFSLDQYRGQSVLLGVYGVGTPALGTGFRELDQLQQDFSARGLVVVGVLAGFMKGENPEDVAGSLGATIPIVLGSSDLLKSMGPIRALPTLVLVDPKGVVRKTYPGHVQGADLRMDVEALLTER